MARPRPKLVFAAALFACLPVAAIAEEGMGPEAYIPALNVYIDGLVGAHAAAAACAPPGSPALDEKAWGEAKAVFTGTLWANGYPAAFINDVTRRLDAVPADKPGCDTANRFGFAYQEGWAAEIAHAAAGLDLKPVAPPVSPEAWQAIRDAVVKETPLQARLFACIAVTRPDVLVFMVHDWDGMLVKIGRRLIAAGLPRDQVSMTLGMAEANALWQPAPPDVAALLVKSCASDQTWQDRFDLFQFVGLASTIDKLLPPPAEGAN